jgi:putative flippase GtrA
MRFWRFNAVGMLGFAVQLGLLALLVRLDVHYLVATAIAVEAAILHNFLWHERWTWRDRPGRGRARLARLGRFHVVNGGVSLAGNLLLMPLLVRGGGLPVLAANGVAVLACAAVNFVGADRLVFSLRPVSLSRVPIEASAPRT